MSELFGRIDIEWFPCLSVDILHEEAQLTFHARLYAEQTMLGAAALALSTGETPEELRIKVCSPGGTTIEGVKSFEKNELDGIVAEATAASYRRTLELAGK